MTKPEVQLTTFDKRLIRIDVVNKALKTGKIGVNVFGFHSQSVGFQAQLAKKEVKLPKLIYFDADDKRKYRPPIAEVEALVEARNARAEARWKRGQKRL
jgi:hypothetical protein